MSDGDGRVKVNFIHVPKTGGSAIKAALRPHAESGPYRLILHKHKFTLADSQPGEPFFFFLRDPASWFVSGFYSRKRCGRPRYNVPWSAAETVVFERFTDPQDLALALGSSNWIRRRHAEQAMKSIRHIRRGIGHWLGDEFLLASRRTDALFIGFQETLSEDFAALRRILGLPDAQLPIDEVAAHRNPQSAKMQLTARAEANLRSWYAEDYRLIEFCRQLRGDSQGSGEGSPTLV